MNQSGLSTNSFTPTSALPVGDYSWWVRASNNSGSVGGWSVSLDFNVGGKPVVLTPGGTTSNRTPTFSWSPVQGADHYQLWVSKRDGTGGVINLTNLTTTSYTPSANLVPYGYRVWVRAVSTTGAFSSWSLYVDFTVTRVQPSLDLLDPEELSSILVSVLWKADSQWQSKPQTQPIVVVQSDTLRSSPENDIESCHDSPLAL